MKKIITIILLFMLILPSFSSPRSENPILHVIAGRVVDEEGNGINRANVTVINLENGITKTAVTETNDNEEKGYYYVVFEENEFSWGDSVFIEAKKGALYGNATTIFINTGKGYQLVNVTVHYITVYAIVTGPIDISDERNITITYNYTGLPDYVAIYYSNDGNTTWNLAGYDYDLDGKFNFTLPENGIYGFIASAILNGSETDAPLPDDDAEAYPYIFDTHPPNISITLDKNYTKPGQQLAINWFSYDNIDNELNISLKWKWNNNLGTIKEDLGNNGTYNWTVINFPDKAIIEIKAIAKDDVGNTGSKSAYVVIDTSPPCSTLSFIPPSPDGNNGWYKSNVEVNITSIDNGSGVKQIFYRINGGAWKNYSKFMLNNGTFFIEYYAVDNIGNTEEIKNAFIKIDNEKPTTNINISPPSPDGNNGWYKSNVTIEFNAIDNISGINVTRYFINDSWMNYSQPFIISDDGIYMIKYYSIDNAGNFEDERNFTIKIDSTAPTILQYSPKNITIPQENITIIFSESISNFSITLIQGNDTGGWNIIREDTYMENDTIIVTHNPWEAGDQLKIKILYEDVAGNIGEFSWSINVSIVYAIATGPIDVSNERNITITYNYTGLPDYIAIYYSNDGNTTWNLAGYDYDLDGKFNFTLPEDGIYGFIAIAVGNGSIETTPYNESAEVYPYILDTISPSISLEFGRPRYDNYITSNTSIYINASDNTSFTIYWKIWGMMEGNDSHNIILKINAEGEYTIGYWAVDEAGNKCPLHNVTLYVDNTSPMTIMEVGSPSYGSYITSLTPIWLNATDNVGINYTIYSIDGTNWEIYNQSFTINGEGEHVIEWYSVDYLGNVEMENYAIIYVDNTSPSINLSVGSPSYGSYITSNTTIYVDASDIVGIKEIHLNIFDGEWHNTTFYSNNVTFTLTNDSIINIYAIDNLNCSSIVINTSFYIDNEPPITTLTINGTIGENGWYISNITINLTSYDEGCGVGQIYCKIDSWETYYNEIILHEGIYNFSYYSIDNLFNKEETKNLTIKIDYTPPSVNLTKYPPVISNNFTVFFQWESNEPCIYSYAINNEWCNWTNNNSCSFVLTQGNYTFALKAKDLAGNIRTITYNFSINISKFFTMMNITPKYNEWISLSSKINLSCPNASTYIRIWHNGAWHPTPGAGAGKNNNFWRYGIDIPINFTLGDFDWAGEGIYYVEFYSEDNGKTETIRNESLIVDATSPITSIISYKNLTSNHFAIFNITAYDNVGISYISIYFAFSENNNFTNYSRIFVDCAFPYNFSFNFTDTGYYAFMSIGTDYLNNEEFKDEPDVIIRYYNPDINNDSKINAIDLIKVIMHWMETPESPNWDGRIDFNGDGLINVQDLILLIRGWTG